MESRKQRDIILLAVGATVLSLLIAALNAFRLPFLNPSTAGEILAFSTVTVVAFLLFLVSLVLLVRNTLRIAAEGRSRVLGARLRTRMVWGALLISLLPITAMFAFSYQLMNRAVERWFSQPAAALRAESASLAQNLSLYVTANARAEAASIAVDFSNDAKAKDSAKLFADDLQSHEATLQGGFVVLYQDGVPATHFRTPVSDDATVTLEQAEVASTAGALDSHARATPRSGPLRTVLWQLAQGGEDGMLSINGTDYLVGSAWHTPRSLIVVALPLPAGLNESMQRLRRDGNQYWILFRQRKQIRLTYMLLMLMISTLALFCASWLALQLSRQITRPVEALAEAMTALAHGDYGRRVDAATTEELGELVTIYNTMAGELQNSRRLVERSTQQVVDANAALEYRRRELETMLQTIPNGVVMLDPERRIRLANRAFGEMLDPGGQRVFVGETLRDVLPADNIDPVERLLQRCHRMSSASAEMEMRAPSGTLNIAVTAALLEPGGTSERTAIGYVVVLENATELLRAQKQSAWKEVARRVAHEIKNPLTPISLSAEQIRRHIGRIADLLATNNLESPSIATIQRSSEVISGSVESMRSLVDQFSSLAEFPHARPRPADLNTIVDNSLAMFAGRLHGISVISDLSPSLPLVLADPEALKRALSNLVDNAAEAMNQSLLREIRITTALSRTAEHMVELIVADTGPGVTDEMRERLFLPYFSTKQRGSGLGLTIAAKIVADHQGTIRVEKNQPSGARFVIELPIASQGIEASADPASSQVAEASFPASTTDEVHA
ncbi:sensor histidine kinase [Terriglobus aquaticus]|uniref:histidine kinase n=1 Tax=Terriglobus aquaticus TaxID=940139 RepID=A0ABW9KN47_9BACT|nr:ATP-binding protein [Terriglobus aquaticus]